jgi:carbonic anhydrase
MILILIANLKLTLSNYAESNNENKNEMDSEWNSLFQSEIQNLEESYENSSEKMDYSNSESELEQKIKPKGGKRKSKSKINDPDIILQKGESLDPVLQNWLKISSPFFKNTRKFPPLELPGGQIVSIKLSDGYFRINEAYNKNNKTGPPTQNDFWFRLSGRHIYYSMNKHDMNVLGAIHLKQISDVIPLKAYSDEPTCFIVLDKENIKWKICATNTQVKVQWVCRIRKELGIDDKDCEKKDLADAEITILNKKVTQPIILIPLPSRTCNDNWDYSKNGDDWECTCKEGTEQSPIDLPTPDKAIKSPVKPLFQYDEIQAKSTMTTEDGRVKTDQYVKIFLDDGLLKIRHNSFGKIVTLDGSIYNAEEIRFHTPSEHKLNGKQYDLEIQIIHTGVTKGDIAKHVVLSFLFEKKPGVYNKFIDDVDFFNLPSPMGKERDIINNLYIPKILYSSDNDDLPIMKPFSFYTYQGSLTAPPCSERTIHYVHANPIPLGTTAVQLFKEATRIPDMQDTSGNVIVNTSASTNNRNVQQLNGRSVYYYDHVQLCGPDPPERPKPKPVGHYEKIAKKVTEYFYVNSSKPSGLPGTFVVSEIEAKGN